MRLLWNFNGAAAPYATRVHGLHADTFQVGIDGPLALPVKGDLLRLTIGGHSAPAQFVCTGRRFDMLAQCGPVLRIDLELA
jgi:hypothetical protein